MSHGPNYLFAATASNGDFLGAVCAPDQKTAETYYQGTGLPVHKVEIIDPNSAHVTVICEAVEIDHDKIDRMSRAKLGSRFWKVVRGMGRR